MDKKEIKEFRVRDHTEPYERPMGVKEEKEPGMFLYVFLVLFFGLFLFIAVAGFLFYFEIAFTGMELTPGTPRWIIPSISLFIFLMIAPMLFMPFKRSKKRDLDARFDLSTEARQTLYDHNWDVSGVEGSNTKSWLSLFHISLILFFFLAPFNWVGFIGAPFSVFTIVSIVFDIFLVAIFSAAVYRFLQNLKFGRTWLRYGVFPVSLGGTTQLSLENKKLSRGSAETLNATLRFVEEEWQEYRDSDGDRKLKNTRYELYSHSEDVGRNGPGGSYIINFTVPEGDEYVTRRSAKRLSDTVQISRYWELIVKGDMDGVDYYEEFLVPIY